MQRGRSCWKSQDRPSLSLDRIGRKWTLCDWVPTQLNLNPPDYVVERLCHELRETPK
jgi:hypothetical protein